jgi:hypothetical protein
LAVLDDRVDTFQELVVEFQTSKRHKVFLQMEEEHPLYNLISLKLDVYIPILP